MRSTSVLLAALVTTAVVTLSACAAEPAPGAVPDALAASVTLPVPGTTDVALVGQGTVRQSGTAAPVLCLGPVAESYPPQCTGPEVLGWDWAQAEYSETASDVTWGTYAVFGTWNGTALTQTQPPIPLMLYSPVGSPDPRVDPANAGVSDEATLTDIQNELDTDTVLSATIRNGYLFVSVVYDDGTIQDYVDDVYGSGVIAVQSALRAPAS